MTAARTARSRGAGRPTPAPLHPRLRVLFFANSVAIGGAETQLVRVATGLAALGHEVTVAVLIDLPGWEAALRAAGVQLVQLGISEKHHAAGGLVRAVRLVRRLDPDAVVGFDFQATMLARIVGRLADVDVIVSSIRNEDLGGGPLRELTVRLSDALTSVTTTNSRQVAASLVRRRLVPESRVQVVHNGIDARAVERPELVRRRTRRRLGIPGDTFLWLTVAHLRATKGLPNLVAAAEQLVAMAAQDVRLVVAGGGEQFSRLHAQLASTGQDRVVTLLGMRDDVPELLAAADGFVLSSTAEGLPNAIMEAMAAGLPVVSTRVGGVAELVEDGTHGRLVPPEDPAALSAAMCAVMALPVADRRRMGAAGRARVADEFDLAKLVVSWERLIRAELARCDR